MSEQIACELDGMVKTATRIEPSKDFESLVVEGLSQSNDACFQFAVEAKDMGKVYEGLQAKVHNSARVVFDKLIDCAAINTQNAFDHMKALAMCKDLEEAARLQGEFAQTQFDNFHRQFADLFGLSSELISDIIKDWSQCRNRPGV